MTLVELSDMRRLFSTIFLLQIIPRLENHLDANKQAIKSQCLECLEKLLEAQITCISTAISNGKEARNKEIENLQQRFAAHNAQLAKATKFQ